jgi:EmrB/QacA subfamily drug resistance transporter
MASRENSRLVLVAMIFAVAMTFIDQTIVSIAVPELQKDLGLSETGLQWVINAYLLSLSALFAFGGRLGDILGHRRMVVLGVVIFAAASALCGATPTGDLAEAWIIVFRLIQGAGAALMFPAALAIVVASFPVDQRGKALAIFFAVTGGLTAIGPLAGGYLVEIDWRAIFWVNLPVAVIALVLTAIAKPEDERRPARLDWTGTLLVCGGMGLSVLGLQQSTDWGWDSVATIGSIAVGLVLLAAFVRYELRVEQPVIDMSIFRNRSFAVENSLLFLLMIGFVPLFFFSSSYAQISLDYSASEAGLYLLTFFAGFATASQIGGRILDSRGARPSVLVGFALTAAGFFLWARQLPDLDFSNQWYWIVLTGAGMGFVLSPASTDAINQVSRDRYGEATGINQTLRNYGSSLGMAVLGSIFISQNTQNIESSLGDLGIDQAKADAVATAVSQSGNGASEAFAALGDKANAAFAATQLDYAQSLRSVYYVLAGVMAVSFVVAVLTLPGGRSSVDDAMPAGG